MAIQFLGQLGAAEGCTRAQSDLEAKPGAIPAAAGDAPGEVGIWMSTSGIGG